MKLSSPLSQLLRTRRKARIGRTTTRRLHPGPFVWLATMAFALPVAAQEAPVIEHEFTVQRFDPAPGPRNFITTRGARTDGEMTWSAGLMLNYAFKPFVVVSCESDTNCDAPNTRRQDVPVVENMVTSDLLGSFTPMPLVQVGLRIPVTWVKGQGLTPEGNADLNGLSAVGLGDAELEGKVRLHGNPQDTVVIGGSLFLTGPFGTLTAEDSFIGDSSPTVGIRGIFDGSDGPASFGANIGGVWRSSARVGSTELGPELRYSVAGGYKPSPVIRLLADGFGSTKFSSKNGTNALEIDAGLQFTPLGSPLALSAGVGTGVIEGVGVPTFRAFLGAMYVAERRDRDNDGVWDDEDQCPTEPEDRDGYEDSDGCPDADNDGDTIADHADKCPNQAEDPDGFEDLDGCPDPDNDKDGIPDVNDACPDKPETKNGFQDQDGCPDEPDTDGDGVPDARDKCPTEAEDTDGFEDTDGCPDPDNDGDGIPDIEDECIDQPETKNGFQDEDGCPDETPADAQQRR